MIDIRQLIALGLSRSAIGRRVQAGRLHPIHRGVYAIGHRRLQRQGRWTGAVLACGPAAALSHRAAAALWELIPARGARIDVTRPGHYGSGSPRGVSLHRVRRLDSAEKTIRDGIACTSVARTLLDVAATERQRDLERACERAETLQLLDMRAIEAAMGRGRRGTRALRALLGAWSGPTTLTRGELEERFLALVRAAQLPEPRLNVSLLIDIGSGHIEVDALWPCQRLVVELDGREVHGTRAAFERDRARDVALLAAGWHVARFTWHQIVLTPDDVARRLAELLTVAAVGAPPVEAPRRPAR